MEQTLLPGGVPATGARSKKGLADLLTSVAFRVMYVSANTEEVRNANRGQEPETWNPTGGPVPQAELLLPSGRGRRQQAPLPLGGRSGVQEPLGGGNGHHRACLRWVGLLERGDGHDGHCGHCAPAYREFPGGDSADHRDHRGHIQRRQAAGRGTGTCDGTYSEGGEDFLPDTQPEGRIGGPNSLVLPRLWQELPGCLRPDAPGLPARSSGRLTPPDDQIATSRQAPRRGGLSCLVIAETTRALTSRGGAK